MITTQNTQVVSGFPPEADRRGAGRSDFRPPTSDLWPLSGWQV